MLGIKSYTIRLFFSSEQHVRVLNSLLMILREDIHSVVACRITRKKHDIISALKGRPTNLHGFEGLEYPAKEAVSLSRAMQCRIGFCSMSSSPYFSASYSPSSSFPRSFSSSSSYSNSSSSDAVTESARNLSESVDRSGASYDGLVDVLTGGDTTITLSATWLRENCRCQDCYYEATSQRKVLFHHLSNAALTINETILSPDRSHVDVKWMDSHASRYDVAWLNRNSAGALHNPPPVKRMLWSSWELSTSNLCRVEFDELVTKKSVESRRTLLSGLLKFGFAFVDGTPVTEDATVQVASQICTPLKTLYGDRWTFGDSVTLEYADTAYTSEPIGAHTDGTYYRTPAGVQILHCLSHEGGVGGESLLVDGFKAAEELHSLDPEVFKVLTQHMFDHQYIDESNSLHSSLTVLKVDPVTGGLEWIRYNPYDRSPLVPCSVCHSALGTAYNALARLGAILESPENQYRTKLQPGTVLLMDNWRVLHGRTAFSGRRVMTGCYLGRDEWISAARLSGVL